MKKKNIDIRELTEKIISGERLAIARGITIIENNKPGKEKLISGIYPHVGKAHRIGIAGPPGVGKSTITFRIAESFRNEDIPVGIVAVDPTSSFTGGALLGDRIRMNELFNDPDVFIRSMATRGSMGGLAVTSTEAADVLDASGKPVVIFETVGIGQSELDIAETCDTVVLVLAPESGDGIQAMKAGFMEIADIFVVNKADREGADKSIIEIQTVLSLRDRTDWEIPVIKTSALQKTGIAELTQKVKEHNEYLKASDLLETNRKKHFLKRVHAIVRKMLRDSFWTEDRLNLLEDMFANSDKKHKTPYQAARYLVDNFFNGGK